MDNAITGQVRPRSLYDTPFRWHRATTVSELRELRRAIGVKQAAFAVLLGVPLETLRACDSGRRASPTIMLQRAKEVVAQWPRDTELLSVDRLAHELGVHPRTLRAAALTGHLAVHFSSRSAFGRPIRRATRVAGEAFMRDYYRNFAGHGPAAPPLPTVPADYDARLKTLRRRLRLTQSEFAQRVGAASKAVIYQWESRKRAPSPVFWKRIETLSCALDSRGNERGQLALSQFKQIGARVWARNG